MGAFRDLSADASAGAEQPFLKKVGAGVAGLDDEKIIKNIFIYILNILLSIRFHII